MKQKIFSFLPLLAIIALLASCRPVVNPNEWVVSTGTCWNTMTVTKAGQIIPRLLTPCDRMVILPATAMAADFECETKFQNRVAGKVNITYQWLITDPIAFIQSAKSVTSSPTDGSNKIDPNALEAIENAVVDKMLIDLIREYTPTKEAGLDELQIEKDLYELSRAELANRGVQFENMSINVTFTPQIEEALDIISALQFYEAKGERELGVKVIQQKAGAANIQSVVTRTAHTQEE